MKTSKTSFALLSLVLAPALTGLGGCLAVAAAGGAAGVFYVKGDLEVDLDGDPRQVAAATQEGLEDLDLKVEEHTVNALDALIKSHTAGGDAITIRLEAHGDSQTHVSIRVGTFGDEDMSARILDAIRDNL